MHPNPAFHTEDTVRNLAYAQAKGFGILAVDGPLLSHVPFLVKDDTLGLHLVRSNPIARALRDGPMPARIAVSGPEEYISPDWYEVPDQVPTWNYVAVHLWGQLELRPQDELRALIDAQSAFFEEKLGPKPPWTSDKMTPDVMDKMMRQIVPCRMCITGIDGTWKLNQNKPDDVRMRAADQVEAQGNPTLAALMREA
jgi:transcriptional regulator